MFSERDPEFLRDMLTYARIAHKKIRTVTPAEWQADDFLRHGIAHMIQIVGEAASRLSQDARDALPELPWRDMIGTRHRLVHGYGTINFDVLWRIANERLPELIAALEAHLTPPEPPSA